MKHVAAWLGIWCCSSVLFAPARAEAQPARDPGDYVRSAGQSGSHNVETADEHAAHVYGLNGPTDVWLPAVTPGSGLHASLGQWSLLLHGQAFVQYVAESGSPHYRGRQFGSTNWVMFMAERSVGTQRIRVHSMVTAEPWTVRGCGYPDLLATGETCGGDSIHDRQHPHDLFMELAADYERPLTISTRVGLYGGLSGAPALGPPPFMHRPSAVSNPLAPIGHHWLDSTHVSFGVVTAAISGRQWKIDSSLFNGREPDEDRRDVDLARLDSVSARFSVNPTARLALQVSAGHVNDAEAGIGRLTRQDVNHVVASAIAVHPLPHGTWSTTIAYGFKWGPANIGTEVISQYSSALLVESLASVSQKDAWFGRLEIVGKPAHDLHADEFAPAIFEVAKLQLGYVRTVAEWPALATGIGTSISASVLPEALAPRYEGRLAPGVAVFFRLSTAGSQHH